jgi:hypothetical protein
MIETFSFSRILAPPQWFLAGSIGSTRWLFESRYVATLAY